jgi:hypothetical protein
MNTASLMLLVALLADAGGAAQAPAAHLSVTRNNAGEVMATVEGSVRACGITAGSQEPTFAVHGNRIDVTQPTIAVACINPPPVSKPYRQTLNFGKLPPGAYTIHWSFPELTAGYVVAP